MRPRMTTRRWLLVIAGVGLLLATWNESYYRRTRNFAVRIAERSLRVAQHLEELRDFCRENAAHRVPYDSEARIGAIHDDAEHPFPYDRDFFSSWDVEARYHAQLAERAREAVDRYREEQRAAERHMIFP